MAEGVADGMLLWVYKGDTDGILLGELLGLSNGLSEGMAEGVLDGMLLGVEEGDSDGSLLGELLGLSDGFLEGWHRDTRMYHRRRLAAQ
jgi:hypothetical protein